MYKIYDGILGEENNNKEFKWGTRYDTSWHYIKNLEKNADKLKYFNSVTYKLNEFGHRCKNINELDLNNYILFVGCSHTVGIGNYLEDSYPYLLSRNLQIDYYNLAVPGSGTDIHTHNLSIWIQKYKTPKLIVWQWTSDARVTCDKDDNSLTPIGPWDGDKEYIDFLLSAEKIGFLKARRKLAREFLKTLKVPIIQVDTFPNDEAIILENLDLARDMRHFGPKSNFQLCQKILDYYLNKYKNHET